MSRNTQTMHQQLAGVLRSATEQILGRRFGCLVRPRAAYRSPVAAFPADGVVALVGVTGEWAGTGSLCCSPQLACTLASRLELSTYERVNDDVLEAVSEITYMLMVHVGTSLQNDFDPASLSIPTVIHGHSFTSRAAGAQFWTIAPCFIGREVLQVQVCLARTCDTGVARVIPEDCLAHVLVENLRPSASFCTVG